MVAAEQSAVQSRARRRVRGSGECGERRSAGPGTSRGHCHCHASVNGGAALYPVPMLPAREIRTRTLTADVSVDASVYAVLCKVYFRPFHSAAGQTGSSALHESDCNAASSDLYISTCSSLTDLSDVLATTRPGYSASAGHYGRTLLRALRRPAPHPLRPCSTPLLRSCYRRSYAGAARSAQPNVRSRLNAAEINVTCVNACGVLPRPSPPGLISSEYRSTWFP